MYTHVIIACVYKSKHKLLNFRVWPVFEDILKASIAYDSSPSIYQSVSFPKEHPTPLVIFPVTSISSSIGMTLLLEHVSDKDKPWPGYFIVRTTGDVVPLIPVDELPSGIDLKGVSRSLDLKDTIGMLNLGLQRSSGALYQLAKESNKEEHLTSPAVRNK